jgi:sugar lactone lactonase YvrE
MSLVSTSLTVFTDGKLKKIYERIPEGTNPILKGAETIVFDNDGTMYALTEEAKLVKLADFVEEEGSPVISAKATEVVHLGVGRPLGAKFAADGSIYIADAHLGLIRVKNPQDAHSKVELIASRVKDENGTWSQILYANDVAVGPKTGMVYFTDGK